MPMYVSAGVLDSTHEKSRLGRAPLCSNNMNPAHFPRVLVTKGVLFLMNM